jgi:hypothetical protein
LLKQEGGEAESDLTNPSLLVGNRFVYWPLNFRIGSY